MAVFHKIIFSHNLWITYVNLITLGPVFYKRIFSIICKLDYTWPWVCITPNFYPSKLREMFQIHLQSFSQNLSGFLIGLQRTTTVFSVEIKTKRKWTKTMFCLILISVIFSLQEDLILGIEVKIKYCSNKENSCSNLRLRNSTSRLGNFFSIWAIFSRPCNYYFFANGYKPFCTLLGNFSEGA